MSRPLALALCLAPAGVVLACLVTMSPVAMTIAVVVLALAIVRPPVGPDLSYLDTPPPVRVVTARPVRAVVRFLPPVDDRTGHVDVATASALADRLADVSAEIDRLIACYENACRTRHRTRAASYAARIESLRPFVRA